MSETLTFKPEAVGIATSCFYPKYRSGALRDDFQSDKIRGELALGTMQETLDHGYQLTVVDGGSSDDFKTEADKLGVKLIPEKERGMSASRRQAMFASSKLPGVQVVNWTEPEKKFLVKYCIETATKPIFDDEADITIPERSPESFSTYPSYQAAFEQGANKKWNKTLRENGIYMGERDLDAWIGPRFIRNNPDLIDKFMKKYQYYSTRPLSEKFLRNMDPELWANAIFLPVVAAMLSGYRVVGQPVPYLHPAEQTAFELDSPEFQHKRLIQDININGATKFYVLHAQGRDNQNLYLAEAA